MSDLQAAAKQALEALAGYRREIGLLTNTAEEQPCDAELALGVALGKTEPERKSLTSYFKEKL